MKIGSIVIHCYKFNRMVAFWQVRSVTIPGPAGNGWVVLRDPKRNGPNVSFQARKKPAEHRSWLHLNLYSNDQKGEVERLIKLRATRYPERYKPDDDFIVLEDPDGNLFCVVQVDDKD